MTNKPLISIIIPMYNAEKYIQETIESVLAQTYTNWEMIIVDNCSTDKSKKIVQNFITQDHRIQLIELDRNSGGPARPRNIGIEHAKGEYIAFLDADDVWTTDKLTKQIDFMIIHNVKFSSTNFIEIDENSQQKTKSFKTKLLNNLLTKKRDLKSLLWHNFIVQSSVMIKTDVLTSFKYDEDRLLIAIEDYFLWLELFINKVSYKYINDELVLYRVLDNSTVERNNKVKNRLRRNYAISKISYKYNNIYLYKTYCQSICLKNLGNLYENFKN